MLMKGGIAEKLGKRRGWLLIAAGLLVGAVLIIIGSSGGTNTAAEATAPDTFVADTEKKIALMTALLTGSDDVSVAVFVSSSREYVYASDTDGQKSSYAVVKNGDSGNGLVLLKEIYPKIESVAIVCKGGDNASVQAKLIKLVSAATGLSSNRISIAGSK